MKDEFPITRLFCLNVKNISSVIFHHIAVDTCRYSRFYKEDILNSLRKCEQDIDDIDNKFLYVEWSRENWPPMIRELIDSVEYRAELQDAYDKWIEMVSEVKVYGEKEFSRLMEGREEGNPIDELGISLLRRISRMMKAMFILIQELKIEYNLYDKDDYNLSPAFIPFYETIEYFNGPDVIETAKKNIPHKKERKARNFRDIIQYPDKEKLIKRLHELIDGKHGADVGCVLLRAIHIDHYLTRNPKREEYESEFKLIRSWNGIHKYLDENNLNALDRANKIVIFD